jgi:hypothetical protein
VATQPPTIDIYAPLSHKQAIGPNADAAASLAPTWVPKRERRRLDAYRIRASYRLNIARYLARSEAEIVRDDAGRALRFAETDAGIEDRREYGDAELLVDRVVAGVLGDNFELVVDGADADLPDEPELPDEPTVPAADATDVQKRVFEIRKRLWSDTIDSILHEWERAWTEQPALLERQDWLRRWADDELVASKIVECEGDICGLADGVYTMAWSSKKQRPIVDVYDPGFYFPVLTDSTREFPRKVHLAWEFEEDVAFGASTRWVRRLTWEIGPILPKTDDVGQPLFDGQGLVLQDAVQGPNGVLIADRLDPTTGSIVRDYPWNVDDDGAQVPSGETCYFTDASFPFRDLDARTVSDFDEAAIGVRYASTEDGKIARRLDLRHDFLPVLHIPNTPAHREHFGQSVIDLVAQILDDIQIGDTDIADAAALAAGPAVALSGDKTADSVRVRPGTIYNVGQNGRMDVLDLSQGLAELAKIQDNRLDRLSVNGRVPAEVLGRTEGAKDLAGVSILLRFGPFIQLIGKLRMTREPKYRLFLKFAQRLAQLGGVLEAGANPEAHIAFGSYLPSDRAQLVEQIAKLLQAKAISTQTAVTFLVAGGFTIDDARGEVQRIHAEDGSTAKDIADATGAEQLAADYLGVELPTVTPPNPTPPTPPVPTLPPTPPAA